MGMREMTCTICDMEFAIQKYGEGTCPRCGQLYAFDEAYRIRLTDAQRELLRASPEKARVPQGMTLELAVKTASRNVVEWNALVKVETRHPTIVTVKLQARPAGGDRAFETFHMQQNFCSFDTGFHIKSYADFNGADYPKLPANALGVSDVRLVVETDRGRIAIDDRSYFIREAEWQ